MWNLYDIFREASMDDRMGSMDSVLAFIAIITNTYVPNQNTDEFFSIPEANEVAGTGYTAGGNACLNPTVSQNAAGLITFDVDDPAVWVQDPAGFTDGRRLVIYDRTGANSGLWRLIAYSNAEAADFGNVAGPVTVTIDAAGVYTSPR